MATLGDEVKNPSRVLPRVIVVTLLGVLALYGALVVVLLSTLGPAELAQSPVPLAQIAPQGMVPWVVAVAGLASLGSLAAVLAGLSRTSMAMADSGDLPARLGRVWTRTSSPAIAEITMALGAMIAVALVDTVWLVGASSSAVLSYYAIAHACALRAPAAERILPVITPWVGLMMCLALVVTLPWQSLATGGVVFVCGLVIWKIRHKPTLNH